MTKQNSLNNEDKLTDESKLIGSAENIYFVSTSDELTTLIKELIKNKESFTIQGGRTSITGSSVSNSKNIINIENFNETLELKKDGENYSILCDSGVRLSELKEFVSRNASGYFFAPNPTEETSTIGGLISTNAKGTNHIKYGSVLDKIKSLKVLLPSGKIVNINRGENIIKDDEITLPNGEKLVNLNNDNLYSGPLGISKNKDVLSIFTGSEGVLGVILQAELTLDKKVDNKYGVYFFFKNDKAKDFSLEVKKYANNNDIGLSSLEYFDSNSLAFLRDFKDKTTKLKMLPNFDENWLSSVYIELEDNSMENLENNLFYLLELFGNFGGEETDTWAGVTEEEIGRFMLLRHALPEAINTLVEVNKKQLNILTKIGCDFKVDGSFTDLLNLYETEIQNSGILGAIFGHIGDNHLHVNLLPKNTEELDKANAMVNKFAEFVSKNNGCLAFENGVGKIKKDLIKKYIDKDKLDNALKLKHYLDKDNLFNPNNMI